MPDDRRRIHGTESVRFTPDRGVREIVLRLWPNAPRPAQSGGDLAPTRVSAAGMTGYTLEKGRTLLRIRLRRAVPAGTPLQVGVAFRLTLPVGADDRYGARTDVAWWGSGFPLLSYVRGEGYATEAPTALFAEASTSEEFRLAALTVDSPPEDEVLATGTPMGRQRPVAGGRMRWQFQAASVRDVAIAVGRFRISHDTARGVPITVGVTRGLSDDGARIASVMATAIRAHSDRFGPFPYPRLVVPVVPDLDGGIEYPGAIYLGTNQMDATPSHEVGHEYFYGLVGDDQARDPWLDEAFATYAEGLARDTASSYERVPIPSEGLHRVGEPMSFWSSKGSVTYFRSVYVQGAAALFRARRAAGTAAFDRAIRCYLAAQAHSVATPKYLQRAIARLPAAVAILREAGALPGR